jgi:hypothetical protein
VIGAEVKLSDQTAVEDIQCKRNKRKLRRSAYVLETASQGETIKASIHGTGYIYNP